MTRLILMMACVVAAAGCTVPTYEAEPVSAAQWQRRQEAIERREAERVRLCRITKEDDPRKEELCRGVAGARQ